MFLQNFSYTPYYSPHHKGYRCLDSSGRVYISKDVFFHETRFPFQEHSKLKPIEIPIPNTSPLTILTQPPTFPCPTSPFPPQPTSPSPFPSFSSAPTPGGPPLPNNPIHSPNSPTSPLLFPHIKLPLPPLHPPLPIPHPILHPPTLHLIPCSLGPKYPPSTPFPPLKLYSSILNQCAQKKNLMRSKGMVHGLWSHSLRVGIP